MTTHLRPAPLLSVLVIVVAAWLAAWARPADAGDKRAPQQHQLQLVLIADTTPREYLFVLGGLGFKTVAALKKFIEVMPEGSTIRWDPGCDRIGDEPLLSSPKDLAELKKFCADRRVQFILVPSG